MLTPDDWLDQLDAHLADLSKRGDDLLARRSDPPTEEDHKAFRELLLDHKAHFGRLKQLALTVLETRGAA
jgi:hypothetical protein